jgi:hypothetical protein
MIVAPRRSLLTISFCLSLIWPLVAIAGNAPVGGGGSCSYSTEGDGTVGQQQAYDNGLYTCLSGSSTWSPEAFIVGSVFQSGSAASCSSTYAGMIQWTGSAFQGCNGSSWISLGGGGSSATLGTSASVTNPQRSGDATTGLFSPAVGTVATSISGTEMTRVTSTGLGVGTTAPNAPLELHSSTASIFAFSGSNGVKWTPLSRPFFGRNKLRIGGV